MTCTRYRRLVLASELLRGPVNRWLRERLAPHAATCPRCRAYDSRLRAMPVLLRGAYEQETAAYVTAGAPAWRVGPLHRDARRVYWAGGALVAASLATALVAARFAGPRGPRAPFKAGTLAALPAVSTTHAPGPSGRTGGRLRVGPARTGSSDPRLAAAPESIEPGRQREAPPADGEYLNGQEPGWVTAWLAGGRTNPELSRVLYAELPPVRDDFVRVPLPLLADAGGGGAVAERALEDYKQQAAVVDGRLFAKVSLTLKGGSLDQFCAELERQTGVRFHAARGLGDEKATLLLEDRPARDVMRAVARLFGYFWTRSGEPGAYRYALEQGLKGQLAEEELRARDVDSALLSLDASMAADAPLLGLSLDQIREKAGDAKGAEQAHLKALANGGWGGLQVYHRLTPAERSELRREGHLAFTPDNPNPERRLPPEWKQMLLDSCRLPTLQEDGTFRSDSDLPGAEPVVVLTIDHSEAGQLTLHSDTFARIPGRGGTSLSQVLAVGKTASTESPENAAANARFRSRPELQKKVTLQPTPSCPYLRDRYRNDPTALGLTYGTQYLGVAAKLPEPHLNSADVWEEFHKKSGLPVVADFYSRIFPQAPFDLQAAPVFDALCGSADHLGARWTLDGGFILARSTGFFWDKLKEVPGRYLDRWSRDRAGQDGLPLEDLIEMASCTPQQLDSARVAEYIRHCAALEEWMTVGGSDANSHNGWRQRIQALGCLAPPQVKAAQTALGIDLSALTPAQQESLRGSINELSEVKNLVGVRFRVDYVPAGWYVWLPVVSRAEAGPLAERLLREPVICGRTREAALAAGRKLLPASGNGDVRRCTGVVSLTATLPDGRVLTEGRPTALVASP